MNPKIYKNFSGQQGLTLIEIMISLTLGFILLGGALQLLIASKNGYRLQDGMGSMQESGRYAIYSLRENILMAGYPGFSNIDPFIPANTWDGESDRISVQFQSATDCLGNPTVGSNAINKLFVNVNNNTLDCSANGKTGTLVEDIESMQILYGVDDDGDDVANLYVSAEQVKSGDTLDWSSIVSVRIALLARSRESSGSVEARSYQLLDGDLINRNDALARRVFTTTIPLRNRIL